MPPTRLRLVQDQPEGMAAGGTAHTKSMPARCRGVDCALLNDGHLATRYILGLAHSATHIGRGIYREKMGAQMNDDNVAMIWE